MTRRVALLALLTAACTTASERPVPVPPPTLASASVAVNMPAPPPIEVAPSAYPWGPSAPATDRLVARFASPPAGFDRVPTEPGSFARFLRSLPLQPEGSPVVDYRGIRLHADGKHPSIVAVADLDVGTKDLQHCADVILRLHAEWRYGKGERDLSYRAVSGQTMAYRGYVAGDRAVIEGKGIAFRRVAGAHSDTHGLLRGWLDEVFSYAGTASLERDAKKVAFTDVAAGDFFVMSGSPYGHAVLVLDVAKDATGRVALLLGQSYMPAQSFQILRPTSSAANGSAWFVVDPDDQLVATPFWQPFPKTALRRL